MRTYKFLLTASIFASVLSTVSSWFFYSRWEEMEDNHFELQKKNSELSTSYDLMQLAYDSTLSELGVFQDPEYRMIPLYAKDAPQKERMRILWNPYNRKTLVQALSLPAIDAGLEYRLYCTAGHESQLIARFSENSPDNHLIPAGKVAAAEHWSLYAATKGDTLAPQADRLLLSSY